MLVSSFFALLSNILFFTSYVENDNSFPKPLNAEMERDYVEKAQLGDKGARDALVRHNMRLVVHIAKKYSNYPDMDELISVGSIGLIKGINTYTSQKGTALATYAARCIENEILMVIRANKKHKCTKSLNESVGRDKDGNELQIIDLLYEEEDSVVDGVEAKIAKERLLEIVKKVLDKREFEIITMRFGLFDTTSLTQREVAKKFDISRSYVSRIEKKALEKIRTYMEKEGLYI